jgi:hypothetical protein
MRKERRGDPPRDLRVGLRCQHPLLHSLRVDDFMEATGYVPTRHNLKLLACLEEEVAFGHGHRNLLA